MNMVSELVRLWGPVESDCDEHGFEAGMILLGLCMVLSFSTLGLSFQVDELVDGNVKAVTKEVQKSMVPLQNFLLAESDVSKVLQSASPPKVVET